MSALRGALQLTDVRYRSTSISCSAAEITDKNNRFQRQLYLKLIFWTATKYNTGRKNGDRGIPYTFSCFNASIMLSSFNFLLEKIIADTTITNTATTTESTLSQGTVNP